MVKQYVDGLSVWFSNLCACEKEVDRIEVMEEQFNQLSRSFNLFSQCREHRSRDVCERIFLRSDIRMLNAIKIKHGA